jgi:hypothetical protein
MKHFYVGIEGGNQGIVTAISLSAARKKAISLFGSLQIRFIREATEEELSWHQAFGGAIY